MVRCTAGLTLFVPLVWGAPATLAGVTPKGGKGGAILSCGNSGLLSELLLPAWAIGEPICVSYAPQITGVV